MPASVFRRGTVVALVLLTLIWSYNWIVMKQVMRDTGPFAFAALRASIATVVLFALLAIRRETLRPPPLVPTLFPAQWDPKLGIHVT